MTESEETLVLLDKICTDDAIKPRLKLEQRWIEALAKAIQQGCKLPPVVCFYDGEGKNYWLADGLDRLEAAKLAEQETILANIRQGSLQEAIFYSKSGSPRNDDKREVVKNFLKLLESMGEDEKKYWSNKEIGAYCAVSNTYVSQKMKDVGYKQPNVLVRKSSKGERYSRDISRVQQNRKSTSKENGFNWAAINDKQFEEIVYEIVNTYNPTFIDWRNGTGGKGRDIEARFKIQGGLDEEREELYFIEAKHSTKQGVKWVKISDAFNWTENKKPSVLVIATSKHFTNPCKDEILEWEQKHPHIHVIRWERKQLEAFVLSKPFVKNLAVKLKLIPKSMQ
jgi:hypothetical protein